MITTRIRGARSVRAAASAALAMGLFWAWLMALWLPGLIALRSSTLSSYLVYSLVLAAGVGWERILRKRVITPGLGRARATIWQSVDVSLRQTGTGVVFLLIYLFLTKDNLMSRRFFITLVPVLFLVLVYYHRVLVPLLMERLMNGANRQSTLLVGAPALLATHADWLARRREQGLSYIGYLSETKLASGVSDHGLDLEHLGEPTDLEDVLEEKRPSTVLFLDSAGQCLDFSERKRLCDRIGARYVHVWDFASVTPLVPRVEEEAGLHMISFRAEPLQDPLNRALKLLLDLTIALPVVVFVLPVLTVIVWIAQQLQSPGPLLYVQERTGLQGKTFRIFKFRTMHVQNPDEARQAMRDDKRVYPLGKWFRKLSIDEFPQFINVLLGDMSVVGPRPHMPAHDLEFAKMSEAYRMRMMVRPGITGLAQIRGMRGLVRDHRDIDQRVNSDLFYVENWTLVLDAIIVLQTIRDLIFPPRSAH